MTCGKGADITSMQRELLRKFNIEVLLEEKSTAMAGPDELQKMLHQKLVNHLSKLKFRVIVILDDVWNSTLVANLLVQGGRVRYLLTTQISTLWNADVEKVKIQDVSLEAARRILGNYAKFGGGVISEDLKGVADEIIARCRLHPLALATLGVVLESMERTVKSWEELKNNLEEHLETLEHLPSSFGQKYPLSVDASMILVLDLLDDNAKQLLYKIALFDGPFIPELLLLLFLKYTSPGNRNMKISKSKLSLVAKSLVQIETESFCFLGHFGITVLHIHSLRQHFILTSKEEEILRVVDFLGDDNDHKFLQFGKRADLDLATALCALYGTTKVKERALKKMGSHFIWNTEYTRGLVGRLASALKPLVSLMLSEGGTESRLSQAAAEVFWNLFIAGGFDDRNIEILLCEEECFVVICNLLSELNILRKTKHLTNNGILACSVAKLPLTLNRLVLLLSADKGVICQKAVATTIAFFALAPYNRVAIVQFPSCLKGLVALLAQDVEEGLQEAAVTCIAQLANCDAQVEMLETPFLLEKLVSFLSKDMGIRCERATSIIIGLAKALDNGAAIVRFPSCLNRFVALLAQDVEKTIQELVGTCFTYLANCDAREEMLATPFLLERLVSFLSEDMGTMCDLAAGAIVGLAVAPQNAVAIVQFPFCLDRLISLLAHDVDEEIQKKVLVCFTYLVSCDAKVDMLGTPFLLERVVLLLSEDLGVIMCENAGKIISYLAVAPQNRVAIVQYPSCLDRLVALLAQDVDKTIQLVVVTCFTYLLDCDVVLDIIATPNFFDRLMALLAQDLDSRIQELVLECFPYFLKRQFRVETLAFLLGNLVLLLTKEKGIICQKAAWTVNNFALASENIVAIVKFPSLVERLVALLSQDVEEGIQRAVLSCFCHLALDSFAQVCFMATPFLMERLVSFLSRDMGSLWEKAALIITALASAPGNRVAIVRFPFCLQRLTSLLAEDLDKGVQQMVPLCFWFLADCDARVDMLGTPYLLKTLVLLLSEGEGSRRELAVKVIAHLAVAPENRVAIIQCPSCLDSLVALLAQDVDENVQQEVIVCLRWLVICDAKVEILATPRLLEMLVWLLSKDVGFLCENAAYTIAVLAEAVENRVPIRQFPSCLERLHALRAQDMDKGVQAAAVRCLKVLVDLHET